MHNCSYCWARRLAETKLSETPRYRDGFKPQLIEQELKKKFRNEFVFVSDMGDLFGDWVPKEWITKVIRAIENSPSSSFLFLTKNPKRYVEFTDVYPENLVLGATIETNRTYDVSKASPVSERYNAMKELKFKNKLVSVEPIMDFDFDTFVQWIRDISPVLVHVGYDNYKCSLAEPSLQKTREFIDELETFTSVKTLTLRSSSSQR